MGGSINNRGGEGKDIWFLREAKGFASVPLSRRPTESDNDRMLLRSKYIQDDVRYLIKSQLVDYSILLVRQHYTHGWIRANRELLNTDAKYSLHAVPTIVRTKLRHGGERAEILYFGMIDILKSFDGSGAKAEAFWKTYLRFWTKESSAKTPTRYGARFLAFAELVFGWEHVKNVSEPFERPRSTAVVTKPIVDLPFYGCLKQYLKDHNKGYLKELSNAIAENLEASELLLADMPKSINEIGTRRCLSFRRMCDSSVMLRLMAMDEIQVANGLEPIYNA